MIANSLTSWEGVVGVSMTSETSQLKEFDDLESLFEHFYRFICQAIHCMLLLSNWLPAIKTAFNQKTLGRTLQASTEYLQTNILNYQLQSSPHLLPAGPGFIYGVVVQAILCKYCYSRPHFLFTVNKTHSRHKLESRNYLHKVVDHRLST